MKISAILIIILAVASAGAYAGSITPQIGGGISQFDGGIAFGGTVSSGPPPTCADDAPDGNFDLSKCSNAIYLAGIL